MDTVVMEILMTFGFCSVAKRIIWVGFKVRDLLLNMPYDPRS